MGWKGWYMMGKWEFQAQVISLPIGPQTPLPSLYPPLSAGPHSLTLPPSSVAQASSGFLSPSLRFIISHSFQLTFSPSFFSLFALVSLSLLFLASVSVEADLLTPLLSPPPLPPWPTWLTAVLMVVSRVGPRGLVEVEDSLGSAGPAWTAVWAAYTTVFIPLSNSLYSSKALHFFLWVSWTRGLCGEGIQECL